jgi:hypothetical protein
MTTDRCASTFEPARSSTDAVPARWLPMVMVAGKLAAAVILSGTSIEAIHVSPSDRTGSGSTDTGMRSDASRAIDARTSPAVSRPSLNKTRRGTWSAASSPRATSSAASRSVP